MKSKKPQVALFGPEGPSTRIKLQMLGANNTSKLQLFPTVFKHLDIFGWFLTEANVLSTLPGREFSPKP